VTWPITITWLTKLVAIDTVTLAATTFAFLAMVDSTKAMFTIHEYFYEFTKNALDKERK
jgi:hypothetical protein